MGVEIEKCSLMNCANILVVDDDETVRFALSKKFTKY